MKVDKDVVKEIVEGIKICRNDVVDTFNRYIEEILQSETVEDVMANKRSLLQDLLNGFPISAESCYFCIETSMDCKICKYAKFHKRCETNKKSSYSKIMKAVDRLDEILCDYYQGEKYPEDSVDDKENNKKFPGLLK